MKEEERERQVEYEAKLDRWCESAQLQADLKAQKIKAKKHSDLVSITRAISMWAQIPISTHEK